MRKNAWLLLPLLVAILAWVPGIDWGLPSRATDRALFGNRDPWDGNQLLALLPADDPAAARGADVDATPLAPTTQPVLLNGTDADRAVIVRRYRLQSRQPDEFINFKALADMARRGDFDPRLYQYGGLWLYSLAAALKTASMLGLVELRGDLAFYLDHPEKFGRFYVVARSMSVAWGFLGVVAVCWIVRRVTDHPLLAALAGIGFASMPIVVNAAHEAKPHLAGTALMLLGVIPATRFVERGRWRDASLAGLSCGGAAAMVVSGVLGLAVLPAMALLRRDAPRRRLAAVALSMAVASLVYVATNPFVLYNAVVRPGLLGSNIGNSTAMYAIAAGGFPRALQLLAQGGTMVLLAMSAVGVIAMLIRPRPLPHGRGSSSGPHGSQECGSSPTALLLLAAPAVLVLVQFVLLADGKPAEYVRFAILPLAAMLVIAIVGIHRLVSVEPWTSRPAALLVGCIGFLGIAQTLAFLGWTGGAGAPSPREVPPALASPVVYVFYEPAPWSCPPIDLFQSEIRLLPRNRGTASLDEPAATLVGPANLASQFGVNDPRETFNWAANRWYIAGGSVVLPGAGK